MGRLGQFCALAAVQAKVKATQANLKGLSALGGGGAPSGAGAGATGGGGAPQFNVVGQGGANQLAQSLGNQEQQPIQAYVVAGAVTTGQALNRNIINNASMG